MAKDITPEAVAPEPKLTDYRILFNLLKILEAGCFQMGIQQHVMECFQVTFKEYDQHPETIRLRAEEAKAKEEAEAEAKKMMGEEAPSEDSEAAA